MPKLSYNAEQQNQFLTEISSHYGTEILDNNQIRSYVEKTGVAFPYFIYRDANRKVARGK